METTNRNAYVRIQSPEGEDYLCARETVDRIRIAVENVSEECVEADVVGRYAGHIDAHGNGMTP